MLSVTEFHESLYRAIDKQNSRKEMIQDYRDYLEDSKKKKPIQHSAFSMSDEEFYKYTGKNVATT